LSCDFGVSPRLADSAAPAAFCCALDFAGIVVSYSVGSEEKNRMIHSRFQENPPDGIQAANMSIR
jgi:hypothetical protein